MTAQDADAGKPEDITLTDTNSTTTADKTQATGPSDGQASTSGAPAQPANPENAASTANAGASPSATVPQDVFDKLHEDYQAVSAERDELKAYAANLSEQLAAQATKLEAAGVKAETALKDTYASAEEEASAIATELASIKARVHAGIDEARVLASRLADAVPVNHPGRALDTALAHIKAKVTELL